MTKTIKKMISVIIATVMMMTLASFVAAADTPTVTVKKTDPNDTTAHKYEFYQVFSASVDTDGNLFDLDWGDGIDTSDTDFYTELATIDNTFTGVTSAATVLQKLETIKVNNSPILDRFATFIESKKKPLPNATAELSATETSKSVALTTGYGYYLVTDTLTSTTGNGAKSKFMLNVVNNDPSIEINTKEVVPELDKDIMEGTTPVKYNQVSVGDEITFRLSSKVPDLRNKGYNKYCFVMNDTLCEGLDYIGTSATDSKPLSVTIGSTTLEEGTHYTYSLDASTNKLEIVFKNFLDYGLNANYIGEDVIVTYKAKLNEKADTTDAGNLNTANLDYSNDPSHTYTSDKPTGSDPKGTTPNSTTLTYTTGAMVKKEDKDGNKLTGAKFQVRGTSSDQVIVTKTVYEQNASGTYYKLKDGTYTTQAPDTTDPTWTEKYDSADKYIQKTETTLEEKPSTTDITLDVDADGVLVLTGLGAGNYQIEETKAPDGYTKDGIVHTLKIECSFNTTTQKPVWTYTIDGNAATVNTAAGDAYVRLTVVNKKTSDLPETGGMGTTIFYVAGSLMLAAGAALIVIKKKAAADK